jgi:metal-dependent HD superfamily phosphatase/phosphodiesterase
MLVLPFWIILQLLLRAPDTPSPYPSTSHGKETHDDVFESVHLAQQVLNDIGTAVHAGDMEVFSVPDVSCSIVRQVLCGVSCDACKTCLISEVLLPYNVFIYFR